MSSLLSKPVGFFGKEAAIAALYKQRRVMSRGCWWWLGKQSKGGYGQIFQGNTSIYVHRLSWELHVGPIPRGLFVLHRCDFRPCFNPDHLFLGSQQDNMTDRVAKRGLKTRRERLPSYG